MESKFNGGLLGLIGVNLVQFLITLITLGIGAPWAVCFKERWIASHTVLDGKQLTFDGTGGQLFGTYIKWMLLTIITIGIYSLWLNINMKKMGGKAHPLQSLKYAAIPAHFCAPVCMQILFCESLQFICAVVKFPRSTI